VIELIASNGYLLEAGEAYLELGKTYANSAEELKEHIGYYQQAMQVFGQAGNKQRQADVGKDLGDLYSLQGNYSKELIQFRIALALYQSINYAQLQGVYQSMGTTLTDMGDYHETLRYGLLAVQTGESLKDSTLLMCSIYNRLGLSYMSFKHYEKGLFYFKNHCSLPGKIVTGLM
jgi:tetratricopeptide (TPR) repeat protein